MDGWRSSVHTYVLRADVDQVCEKLIETAGHNETDDMKFTLEKFWAVESVPKQHTATTEIEESTIVPENSINSME